MIRQKKQSIAKQTNNPGKLCESNKYDFTNNSGIKQKRYQNML